MADVLDAAKTIVQGNKPSQWRYTSDIVMKPMAELVSRYYIRLEVMDRPGVLAGIARCFGDNNVSIASVIQKETDEAAQTAEIVIMTHAAREDSMRSSIEQIQDLELVRQVGTSLRVEG
jgi:homoserine dehydrogenase